MALVPHKITALAESDAQGTDGKNIVAGAIVSLYDPNGTAVTLFDDESGSNGSTAKQTDAKGQVVVYVTAGEYDEEVNGSIRRRVTVGGNGVVSYGTTAELQSSRPSKTGQRAENRERANAQYELAVSGYSALPGDIVAANGRVWKLVSGSYNQTLTVNIPSQYATMQEAIDYYHNKVLFTDGNELVVNIEAGHQPATGISVSNGDYGYIRITSDDPEVTVSASYTDQYLMFSRSATAPIWDVMVDCDGVVERGIGYTDSASGTILPGKGAKNTIERGLYINSNSSVTADFCKFTGIGTQGLDFGRAVWVTRNSSITCESAEFEASGNPAFYVSRRSNVHAASVSITATGPTIITCQRGSTFNGQTATYIGGSSTSIAAVRSGRIIINESTLSGVGGIGLSATGAGASIMCDKIQITPNAGATTAAQARDGGEISAVILGIDSGFVTGLFADRGGRISVNIPTISGCTTFGIRGTNGGYITCTSGSVTGSSPNDLRAEKGSQIFAFDLETTNGAGSPSAADTNFSNFNVIESNKGIIWA